MEEKKITNNKLYTVVGLVLIGIALILGAGTVMDRVNRYHAEKELERLARMTIPREPIAVEEPDPVPSPLPKPDLSYEEKLNALGIPIPEKIVDIKELQETVNKDIYAWIYIPDNMIDYPVLQHDTDDSYYLNYNLDGSKGYPGCIYTESCNSKDFMDPVTILYGHNMKNGSMFAGLHKFEDETYFEEHPYIYVYTEEQMYVYQIFAVGRHDNKHLMYAYDLKSTNGVSHYLEDVFAATGSMAHFRPDVAVSGESHIITLSTCVANQGDYRHLVHGVLVE